jgi:uncharacterized protein YndB with AHSA1/START domain
MRILKRLLIAVALLIVVLIAIAFALPSQFNVARSVTINAPAEKIYPLIATTGQWKNWTVWNQRDPNMKIDYTGPESGLGAKWSWESKIEGSGEMEFTAAEPNKLLGYRLLFKDFNTTSNGTLKLEPDGAGTKVTWSFVGEAGNNPMMRYMGLMMDGMIGKDFEAGLANLKALAERS